MDGKRDPRPATATEALEQLGRLSLRELSMDGLLQTVADLTRAVMPGDTDISVLLLVKNRPTTVVSTGQLAVDLDETQYERGHGPCLHAARTGELTEIPDTRTDTRWPEYTRRAAGHGNLSSLSIPLLIDGDAQVTGALNICARRPRAFDEDSRSAATRFGPYAAVAAGNLHAYQHARNTAENLQLALESRAVIDQAKGVLIERHKLTPDQAFQLLARASMHSHRKVRDLADHLMSTGESSVRRRASTAVVADARRPQESHSASIYGRAGSIRATVTSPTVPRHRAAPQVTRRRSPGRRNPSSVSRGISWLAPP